MKSLLARCRRIVIILPGQDEKAEDLEECRTSAIKGNKSRCSSGEHKTCPSSHTLRNRSSIIGSNRQASTRCSFSQTRHARFTGIPAISCLTSSGVSGAYKLPMVSLLNDEDESNGGGGEDDDEANYNRYETGDLRVPRRYSPPVTRQQKRVALPYKPPTS